MTALATIVETESLLEVIAFSLAAGVGVTLAFSVAILGAARFADMRREDRLPEAAAYGVLGAIGLAACLGALAFGLFVMTSK